MPANRAVVCSSYSGISELTTQCIQMCGQRGFSIMVQTGCADVALARNIALTAVVAKVPNDSDYAVLLVDDDMVFGGEDAEEICRLAVGCGRPVSAIYSTAKGTVAAARLVQRTVPEAVVAERYLTGLGFVAITAQDLHVLAANSDRVVHDGREVIVFTWTGHAREEDVRRFSSLEHAWLSEDYRLILRLGGARLARIGVGHLKRIPLYPDDETIEQLGQMIKQELGA